VLQVEHHNSDSSSALATTRIVFRVDEAIRNVRRGQTLEINEWAGLWPSGERYHPGERVSALLISTEQVGADQPCRKSRRSFRRKPRWISNSQSSDREASADH
jgi:hypothetical protein